MFNAQKKQKTKSARPTWSLLIYNNSNIHQ